MKGPGDTAGRIAALLFLLAIAALFAVIAVRESAEQPMLPLVSASACEPVDPCPATACEVRKPPFGGIDPDAGESDNRRIA